MNLAPDRPTKSDTFKFQTPQQMTDFNIDQYEITVTVDDSSSAKDEDEGTIKPKLYPVRFQFLC